jgi:uncharacterized protein YidB (DUF937 family)
MGLLDSVLGTQPRQSGGGMSPITMALLGVLAYRTLHGKGRLADMLGRASPPTAPGQTGQTGKERGLGDLGGLLGGAGGASLGSVLSNGLNDLLKQFQANGQGDKAQSWVGDGANKPVSPQELAQALGEDKIKWLTEQTGLSREKLLEGLSRELPGTVDKLTPQGRIPDAHEASRMV